MLATNDTNLTPNTMATFKHSRTAQSRADMCEKLRNRYPTRVPIICEPGSNAETMALDKYKFLVPEALTMGQFVYIIRKRLKGLKAHQALFLSCNGSLPRIGETTGEAYERAADAEDGLLYVKYSLESTFG